MWITSLICRIFSQNFTVMQFYILFKYTTQFQQNRHTITYRNTRSTVELPHGISCSAICKLKNWKLICPNATANGNRLKMLSSPPFASLCRHYRRCRCRCRRRAQNVNWNDARLMDMWTGQLLVPVDIFILQTYEYLWYIWYIYLRGLYTACQTSYL